MPANWKSPWRVGRSAIRSRRDALFVVRNGNDAFGLQRVAAGCRRLPAKASTPLDRRRKEAIGLVHLTAQAHDVRRGLELKLFDDAKALAVAVFECCLVRARGSPTGRGCTHRVQRLVQGSSDRGIVDAERKRQRVTRTWVVDDELERLAGRIAVLFETPALEAGAAIRERRDDVLVLEAGFALGRVAHQWTRGGCFDRLGRLFLRRRGRDDVVSGRGDVGGRRGGRSLLGRHHERLPQVQRQECEKDREKNAPFHGIGGLKSPRCTCPAGLRRGDRSEPEPDPSPRGQAGGTSPGVEPPARSRACAPCVEIASCA